MYKREFPKSLGRSNYETNSTGPDTDHEVAYSFPENQCLKNAVNYIVSPHSQRIFYGVANISSTKEVGKAQEILQATVTKF